MRQEVESERKNEDRSWRDERENEVRVSKRDERVERESN